MIEINVKDNSNYPQITSQIEIYSSIHFPDYFKKIKYQDMKLLIKDLNTSKNDNMIMLDSYNVNDKLFLYFFILNKKIIIIDQQDILNYQDYFKKIESSLYIVNKKQEDEFSFLFAQLKASKTEKDLYNFNKSDIASIQNKIINCIIKKSQILTQQRQKIINTININTNTKYNMNDFIEVKYMNNFVQLYYNVNDQFLYILKFFDQKNEESVKYYQREMEFYKTINNQNQFICKFFGTFQYRNQNIIVIEYVEGQTLENFILKSSNQIDQLQKAKIILNIITTTEYIHLKEIILRDLKWDNIIIDSNFNAIFIDFDRAKEPNNDNEIPNTINFGCELFMSPEQYLNGEYSFKSDIYAIGMLIHFILTEQQYFEVISTDFLNELYKSRGNILDTDELSKVPEEFEYLLSIYKPCLEFSQELRPNITELFYKIFISIQSKYKKEELKDIYSLFNTRKEQLKSLFGIEHYNQNNISYDINKLIEYLKIASNFNDSDATFFLGILYYRGKYMPKDNSKAIHYITLAADQNSSMAQEFLGEIYYYGKNDILPDIDKSIHYLTLASNQNDSEANQMLGTIYYEGKFFPKNINKAIYYWKLASNQNHSESQFWLGLVYMNGINIPKDIDKSIYYLTLSANSKYDRACELLGGIYINKELGHKDEEKALYYLQLADQKNINVKCMLGLIYSENKKFLDIKKAISYYTLAANHGQIEAQYCLGKIYYENYKDVKTAILYLQHAANLENTDAQYFLGKIYYENYKDVKKAILYLQPAASKNHVGAQYMLGIIYLKNSYISNSINLSILYLKLASNQNNAQAQYVLGLIFSTTQIDIDQSVKYLTLASNQNHKMAQQALGTLYYEKKYGIQNINKAIHYFTLSQDFPLSQTYLGQIYYEGKYVPQDINKAIHYFTLSSNQNNSDAQYFLGKIYCDGKLVPLDINKGIKLLQSSINQNNSGAMYYLGLLYLDEKCVYHDDKKAFHYLTLASNHNNADAQNKLGELYYEGTKTQQDINKAVQFLTLSSDKNNGKASHLLGKIYLECKYFQTDINKAIYYFKKSISQGYDLSMYYLGNIYFDEEYEKCNINEAIKLFKKSAETCEMSRLMIGKIYYQGIYLSRDVTKAISYFKKCQDYHVLNNFGIIYKNGVGIKKNIKLAINYFEEAIKKGDRFLAPFNLAKIYYLGDEIEPNLSKSAGLLEMASNNVNNFALGYLTLICINTEELRHKTTYYLNKLKLINYDFFLQASKLLNNFGDTNEALTQILQFYNSVDLFSPFIKNDIIFYQRAVELIPPHKPNPPKLKRIDINSLFYDGFNL